jgi:hypothetical protein
MVTLSLVLVIRKTVRLKYGEIIFNKLVHRFFPLISHGVQLDIFPVDEKDSFEVLVWILYLLQYVLFAKQ